MTTDAKILIAGTAADVVRLESCLADLGYTVCTAVRSGREAIANVEKTRPDLALIDLGLDEDISAIDAAGQIRNQFDVPVIYLTDEASAHLLPRARTTAPSAYLRKPFAAQQLHWSIDAALSTHRRQTESKRRIEALEGEVRLLKAYFDSLSDGVVVFNTSGDFLLVNAAAEQIVGLGATDGDLDDLAARYGTFHLDGKTPVASAELPLVRAMHGETVDNAELLIRNPQRPQGVYISVNARPVPGTDAEPKTGVIAFRDITERKKLENRLNDKITALRNQTSLLTAVFNSIGDGMIAVDRDRRCLIRNRPLEDIAARYEESGSGPQRVTMDGLYYSDKVTPVPDARTAAPPRSSRRIAGRRPVVCAQHEQAQGVVTPASAAGRCATIRAPLSAP